MEKTVGDRYKLLGRFQLNRIGKFFTVRTIKHLDNLPGAVMDSPILNTLKIQLDRVLGCTVQTTLLPGKAGPDDDPWGPSPPGIL